ncbi:fumarate reductase/succinate dehydrogenase flavoprotein subunit [Streptomyces sp. p1417]|uniref:Fumarate reductase/succinate dehydrogenase flavoprotein subunit n=1 Tax=Streptomyces typhae TaxID=2681492 RepID=A0A6L6XA15_9ACTN|nr:fumarate reductase/succinate dehydrogenase flavoprotein subunit [Streptomyces typhae]MVO90732.1 fumarate reductase/succinate dehydrogenase flavoprotein subunit [Streptomyces typhae]
MAIPALSDATELSCDVLVVGGGTAGTMAALTAAERGADVLLLEKAHVRHSGALAMGMDGVNNAIIPGRAEPDDYVAEITRANDGVVDQSTVRQTATRGYAMVERLESYGVKFEKDEHGEYAVRQVHRSGSYVLPMPEGKDVKKVLYRQLRRREMRERIRIENRVMPVRVLTAGGRAVGAAGFHTRTGEFTVVRAGAVILATGACGRLGLPASGYLYGTYENPTNAGDGYAMAYHAGAALTGIECFQINPLIKDYNGPACAYVANPFGGYQVNRHGERFVESDYWSGQMMSEFAAELASDRGPVYLKLSHLPEETISAVESILHTTERPTRATFHEGRGHDYRTHDVEMHISEIGLCGGHSASGVRVDAHARTTVPRLYAAGDLACVPHNYMIGAFVFGDLAGADAARFRAYDGELPRDQLAAAHELVYRPLRHPEGPPQPQVEYKLRRFVNDYVAPPKTGAKLSLAVAAFERMRTEIEGMGARTAHELMRCAEVTFIRDCAEMAARASLARTESRWGLYHERLDHPGRDDAGWLHHLDLRKSPSGAMEFTARPVEPYVVPVPEFTPAGGPERALGEAVTVPVATAGAREAAPARRGTAAAPQRTAAAPQGTAPAPQGTAPAPQDTARAPQETTPTPQDTTRAPQETTPTPQDTARAPQETTPTPQDTARAPHETTPTPQETAVAPKVTAPAPQETATAPQETAPAPRETARAPHETARAPHETARAPQETAQAPHETAQAPHETAPSARPAAQAQAPVAAGGPSPALLRLLSLAEDSPGLDALAGYLTDADPAVRATAVAVLAETLPAGAGPALAARLRDDAPQVRAAAAGALRELVEVLPADEELASGLRAALGVTDPAVRGATLDALRALRLGDTAVYAAALADPDADVRIHAVRALVSVDATADLAGAAADPDRAVRVAVARGLAAVRDPAAGPLAPLVDDPDPLVRAAALTALADTGCPPAYTGRAVAALADPAWQVRAGAATALRRAAPGPAVPALAEASADRNADVRKAAVLSLLVHRADPDARAALAAATADTDADVRAYAARAAGAAS